VSGLDWLILGILLLSVLTAVAQGFFFELFSLAGAVIGYLLAAWAYPRAAAWFLPYVATPWIADVAGFLTIFFAVVLLAGFAGRMARWMFEEAGLRWFDRLLGGAFGLARGAIVAVVLVLGMAALSPGAQMLEGSALAPYLLVIGRAAIWLAPSSLRQGFERGLDALRHIQRKPDAPQPATVPAQR